MSDPNHHLKAALEAVAATARALKEERDEAIADRDIARLSAQDSDRAHDRMVGELEKVYKERDEAVAECKSLWSLVNANKLRAYKAERERDEAREAAARWESSFEAMECAGAEQAQRADANREWALRAERERDEVRHEQSSIQCAFEDSQDKIEQLERERDDAREALAAAKHYLTKERDDALAQIVQAECRAERFCQERDEAREKLNKILKFLDVYKEVVK